MNNEPKLSNNFNKKLFQEIKRVSVVKNIFNITVVAFLKVIVSVLDIFLISSKATDKKNKQ